MIELNNIEGVYFVGIGGIGMSALAEYYLLKGLAVGGYDRTDSAVTKRLAEMGGAITYIDEASTISPQFMENDGKKMVVYTPAIPKESAILTFFRENGFPIYKRSEILGALSTSYETVAVAGTHGKTTVSTMTSHILKSSGVDCSAFLGGISKNYGSNLIVGNSVIAVMEADEFDRSFHRLSPSHAVITAADADHLDIYGTVENMLEGYSIFCEKIRGGGTLIINSEVSGKLRIPSWIRCYTYGSDEGADYRCSNIRFDKGVYLMDMSTPNGVLRDVEFDFPGYTNLLNFTAAAALALCCGATVEGIRLAGRTFTGVKRRFDVRLNRPGLTYVDDYAHHPEEIKACITSLLGYFGDRKITGVFQPHLFSRTLDHAAGFAEVLDQLDEVILLPIYPAREKPIEGVTSDLILEKMKMANKRLLRKEELVDYLEPSKLDVLVTIGAGDIDTLVAPIEEKLKNWERI
jgi:UDP-N-acetylmuramate--alanine ligase